MDFKVADSAIGIARIVDVVERWCPRSDAGAVRVDNAWRIRVAFETEELDDVPGQQLRIGRTVRRVASLTAFGFKRRVFVDEGPLFIGVTFYAAHIAIDRCPQRLAQEAAVLVVAVRTFHPAFGHFVMEWLGERGLLVGMTLVTHIRLRSLEQKLRSLRRVGRMAIGARNAMSKMLAAPEV